ncbi:MAG: PqqD family protein [bacterium]|nr:PqqD family protein [bacterium]
MAWRQRQVSRQAMMESVPRLNPDVRWDRLDTGELTAVFRRDVRGIRRVLMKLLAMPEIGRIDLDRTGTEVVDAIDGSRTIRDLIGDVQDHLHLSRKEAEVALLKYMELLGQRGLVGFEIRQGTEES